MKKQAAKLVKWRIHQLDITRKPDGNERRQWSTPVDRHARSEIEAVVDQYPGMRVEAVSGRPQRYTAKPMGPGKQFVLEIICQQVKP